MFLAVGRVLRPHGLNGELRVEVHTDYPERFALRRQVYLGPLAANGYPDASNVAYELQGYRFHGKAVLLKLHGVDDRTQAEAFRDQWVWIPIGEAVPLEEGEYYSYQMLHLRVVTVEGEELGTVVDIIETGANDVYVVKGIHGEVLIPDIEDVVLNVDLDGGQMTVHLLEGLR